MVRVVVLVNAVALNLYRRDNFERPALTLLLVFVMVAWTAFAIWAYSDATSPATAPPAGRPGPGGRVDGPDAGREGPDFNATVPGFWVAGALLAWAIRWRWIGGLIAGAPCPWSTWPSATR